MSPSAQQQSHRQPLSQVSGRPLSDDTTDQYSDPYDAYASIYGLISPDHQQQDHRGPRRQAFPQRKQSLQQPGLSDGSRIDASSLQKLQQQQQQQQQQHQSPYAHSQADLALHYHNQQQEAQLSHSYSQTSRARPSFDVPDTTMQGVDAAEGASVHSHSPLHTPHAASQHRARFADMVPNQTGTNPLQAGPVAAVKINDFATEKVIPDQNNGDAQSFPGQKQQRSLPEGYHTPPSFSRASSGWGTSRSRKQSGALSGSSPNSPMVTGNPYGSLGGIASKSDPGLQFAEGDYAKSKFARFWFGLLASNWVLRWFVFIAPILVLFWIPGICAVTINPTPKVWGVSTFNWSIWLTIVWLGWWAAMLVAMFLPHVLKHTIGTVAPELRHYIEYTFALKKTLAAFLWTLALWVSFQPLILAQGPADKSDGAGLTLSQITKGLFAIFLCSIILLVEKFIIQVVAYNFHKTSYADRIAANKFAVKSLVQLYLNSRDIGRSDTLDGAGFRGEKNKIDPAKIVKKALKSTKRVVTGTTTALGTVASEIIGERVLQSNSPQSMVTSALASANKSRQLARRIWFSHTPSNRQVMLMADIAPFFPDADECKEVFTIFDRDDNGDISLEEIESSCLEIHRERMSLSSSMRDLDSAVGRLDQILMSLYYIVAILLFIGLLSVSFSGFLTSASAFILGLSWLIGSTSQEFLASIVFLLAKHPYDVGDLVAIDGYDGQYVVKEIMLLSTVFKKTDGNVTQIPHTVINTKAIQNFRRGGAASEVFTWEVEFSTTFEQIEALRQAMLEFLESERRDFLPKCDISVADFAAQGSLKLSTSIPYKSNWANSALKAQRRNKWICALKMSMGELQIWGPAGAGNPSPAPADPTLIKVVNPELFGIHAPSYRSVTSPSPTDASRQSAAQSEQLQRGRSGSQGNNDPRPPPAHPIPAIPTLPNGVSNIAAAVNQLELSRRSDAISDEQTDVFDYQGYANREDTLNLGEAAHAASAQLSNERTAADPRQTAEGAALNRFRQEDLELGRVGRGAPTT